MRAVSPREPHQSASIAKCEPCTRQHFARQSGKPVPCGLSLRTGLAFHSARASSSSSTFQVQATKSARSGIV